MRIGLFETITQTNRVQRLSGWEGEGGRFLSRIEMKIITKPILREFPAVGDGGDEIIRRRLSFPLQLIHIHASVHMGFALQQNILHLSLFAHNPVL